MISLFDTEYALKGLLPKELSKDFHKAFALRQVSDYKNVLPLSLEKSRDTLDNAKRF